MRLKQEILKEIEDTNMTIEKMRLTGVKEEELDYFIGWNQALAWILTTDQVEADA
jgi:hypothetical protein